jgi:hypothetical protein
MYYYAKNGAKAHLRQALPSEYGIHRLKNQSEVSFPASVFYSPVISTAMKKISLICVCVLVTWISGYAQKRVTGSFGQFQAGYKHTGLSNLNNSLTGNGYPALQPHFFQMGGNVALIRDNLIVGGEGYFYGGNRVSDDAFSLNSSGEAALVSIGYVSYAHSRFLLYPLAGVGAGRFRLNLREQPNGTPFTSVLNNPPRGVDLRTVNLLANFSLNADYRFTGRRRELVAGLSVGYTLASNSRNWAFDTNQAAVTDGPAVNPSGFFARLRIGLGTWALRSDS